MKVLVISAHMDDEVLGLGGTIAHHVDAGDDVTVCVVCDRAYGHAFDPEATRAEMASAHLAAGILGYKDLRFLGLRDELLDERLLDTIVPLEACVNDVRPEVVYAPHGEDTNQDHRAVHLAVLVVCRPFSAHKARRLVAYEVHSSLGFQPNFYVDIESTLARKIEAMKAYRRELRDFPHPRSLEGIDVAARARGMEVGLRAAEAFLILRDEWS